MEIIFVIILIIGSIIIFKNKDKKFPNNPILGWLVCTIILAVGLYLMYKIVLVEMQPLMQVIKMLLNTLVNK